MASLLMHLYIGQEYYKKHESEENLDEIVKGSLAPDLAKEKQKAHYGPITAKPNLKEYLNENDITDSYQRAYFLHLITDALFYNYLIDIDKIVEEIGLEEWRKKYYKDYDSITASILKKISIEIPEQVKKFLDVPEGRTELFKEEDFFNLAEKLASLDLKKLEANIRNANKCELINLINSIENRDFNAKQEIIKIDEKCSIFKKLISKIKKIFEK